MKQYIHYQQKKGMNCRITYLKLNIIENHFLIHERGQFIEYVLYNKIVVINEIQEM